MRLTGTIFTLILALLFSESAVAKPAALKVTSSAFTLGGSIPQKYGCGLPNEGSHTYFNSPPISWSKVPSKTKSIAIIFFDLDAPGGKYFHWGVFNLPKKTQSLPASYSNRARYEDQSNGDAINNGYFGPCPPRNKTHRYTFYVAALDTILPENKMGRQIDRFFVSS